MIYLLIHYLPQKDAAITSEVFAFGRSLKGTSRSRVGLGRCDVIGKVRVEYQEKNGSSERGEKPNTKLRNMLHECFFGKASADSTEFQKSIPSFSYLFKFKTISFRVAALISF